MSVLDEIGKYLEDEGVGTVGTDLFLGFLPDTPAACVALQEYSASPPSPGFGVPGIQHETPGVQVLARGTPEDYDGPRAKAEAAYKALAKVQGQTLTSAASSAAYLMVLAQQSPFVLDRDAEMRVIFAANFLCEKELSA